MTNESFANITEWLQRRHADRAAAEKKKEEAAQAQKQKEKEEAGELEQKASEAAPGPDVKFWPGGRPKAMFSDGKWVHFDVQSTSSMPSFRFNDVVRED